MIINIKVVWSETQIIFHPFAFYRIQTLKKYHTSDIEILCTAIYKHISINWKNTINLHFFRKNQDIHDICLDY